MNTLLFSARFCVLLLFALLLRPCVAQTALTWDPATTQAGTQIYTHPNALAGDYNFTVVVPAGPEGGLRFRLDVTVGNADLYVKQGAAATATVNDFRSTLTGSDLITLQPAQYTAGQTWHIMVRAVAGASWNLLAGNASVTLGWDPGTADAGTSVYAHLNTSAGDFYFRIATQSAANGGWRTVLKVTAGEANVSMSQGTLPLTSSSFTSARVGSDGWVLRPDQFTAGQDWFIRVSATAGAAWTLFTGNVYVQDMGTLAWTDANSNGFYDAGEAVTPGGSGAVTVGPEGMRFFRQTVPAGTPAWSLWLNGDGRNLAVRRAQVPFLSSASYYGRRQAGQLLLVPPFLGSGSEVYFLGVDGTPGETINLDSRIQFVQQIPFNSTVPSVSVSGSPYRVYRTDVPIDQIAWDVSTTALAGNPNVCVRKSSVPAEYDNDAFSEAPGGTTDSITLVPDSLTNATYYITVYGTGSYTFTLASGDPVVTTMAFTDVRVNDQPARSGWRYYRLTDIPAQVGSLGWELLLSNQVPGSMIALRRNKVPSRWQSRGNGSTSISDTGTQYMDFSGSLGFLQRPGHQADIWYVGVFTPQVALGEFTLDVHPIVPAPVAFNGSSTSMTGIQPGRWVYQTITVPAGVAGWDLRLRNINGPNPQLVVRRDLLPSVASASGLSSQETWASGATWSGGVDWTGRVFDPGPPANLRSGAGIVMSTGRPLEPGTYYVGVYNPDALTNSDATLISRGIGTGQIISVGTLGFAAGSSVSVNNLEPREAAYFTVTVPPNTPSWEFTLTLSTGEMMMAIRRGGIPDFDGPVNSSNGGTGNIQAAGPGGDREINIQKTGPERYVVLPMENADFIVPGDYTIAVVSEGASPPNNNTIGTGTSSGTLTSNGPLAVTPLGAVGPVAITQPVSLAGGQVVAYSFTVGAASPPLEIRLENRIGNPQFAIISGSRIPAPGGAFASYGYTAGETSAAAGGIARTQDDDLITLAAPPAGIYHLVVRADALSGQYLPASADLTIMQNAPAPLTFNGGTQAITGQQATAWRYFSVTVPAGVDGWDLRLKSVTGGTPEMVTRRDFIPSSTSSGGVTNSGTTWPSGATWSAGVDWTGRAQETSTPVNVFVPDRMVVSMGRPLEPGSYIIGVYNPETTAVVGYTIESRGIGNGQIIPVNSMAMTAGSSVSITNLAPREAAYYRVTVPPNTPSWEFTLTPTTGEMMLAVRREGIPDFLAGSGGNGGAGNILNPSNSVDRQVKIQKTGPERYLLLPEENQSAITPGDYTIAVISEGVAPPSAGLIGTGTTSGALTSNGALAVTSLGAASIGGITQPLSLAGGQVKAYSFSVPAGTASLEVRLDNRVGNPLFNLITGSAIPAPGTSFSAYGYTGGETTANSGGLNRVQQDIIYTLANPPATTYQLTIRADAVGGAYPDTTANLVIIANAPVPLAFDGGTGSVSGVSPEAWRYFIFTVPAGAMGWDLRLKNITGGTPQLFVRRDLIPSAGPSTISSTQPTWPSGALWRAGRDWTGRGSDPGSPNPVPVGEGMVASMGRPLEPGTYYAGIYNSHLTQNAACSIESRGIGTGYSIPAGTLGFSAGSSVTVTGLAPRQAAYYTVTVPAGTPSWEFSLTPSSGEVMMAVRRGGVPDFLATSNGDIQSLTTIGGDRQVEVQKPGAERYVLLPYNNQASLTPGDYTIAVISEGVNPPDANSVGTGTSTATLTSHGPLVTTALGAASAAGISQPVTLSGGQVKSYSFIVPAGTQILEMALENRAANPVFASMSGVQIPQPGGTSTGYGYAQGDISSGTGILPWNLNSSLRTVENPPAGNYMLTIRADLSASIYADASATLVIRQKSRQPLNFDPSQNGNGFSHADSRALPDTGKNFYQITVPATLGGQPVLGWRLRVSETQGDARLRLFKTWGSSAGELGISTNSALLVPPFLVPGDTYFLEVTALGFTSYTLTSENAVLERAAWTMPTGHNTFFGDTGIAPGGTPMPGDQGIDLGQDDWHLYAVDVPVNNSGLLRTELQAINGNPNLYIRETGMPSTEQNSFDRSLTSTGTEYANWVPVNGRDETALRPGRWYLGVKSSGSNSRYRLKVSTGQVTDLPMDGISIAGQTLVGKDWRYYRFTVPAVAPATWNLTFSQQSGDVVMWLRDTIPPGFTTNSTDTTDSGNNLGIRSWYGDNKNQGPYSNVGHNTAGTYAFNTAPLRPGHTYYAGFRAVTDSTFTIGSATTGTIGVIPSLTFYGGTINTSIPAGSNLLYRIPVPAEAIRLKFAATHVSGVQLRIEQGTLPGTTGNQHYTSGTNTNVNYNQALSPASAWPWRPGYDYYLRIVNTTASAQNIVLNMDPGFTFAEWRSLYFNSTELANASISGPNADPDNDGISNVLEAAFGTHPRTASSVTIPGPSTQNSGFLVIEFLRATVMPINLTLTVRASNDMTTWTTLTSKTGPGAWSVPALVNETPATGSRVLTTVRDTSPYSSTARRYMRVEASVP